jgi:hypothetical protein
MRRLAPQGSGGNSSTSVGWTPQRSRPSSTTRHHPSHSSRAQDSSSKQRNRFNKSGRAEFSSGLRRKQGGRKSNSPDSKCVHAGIRPQQPQKKRSGTHTTRLKSRCKLRHCEPALKLTRLSVAPHLESVAGVFFQHSLHQPVAVSLFGLPAGSFDFLSAPTRSPFTPHEKALLHPL